jgi:pSer/pThr/pTyr-binding forkhead associated (FHA) protein
MAFVLRNISYSADGRQIVRSSRIRDDLLKIGRDPDSDIRLNDLAVALHHATIEQVSSQALGISAESGTTIDIDGTPTQGGQIDLTAGGTIRIGPFRLRVSPQEMGSDDVAIDVERADTEEAEDRFDTRRFALASVMPGKRPIAWASVLAVLILFLAWPIWSFHSQPRGAQAAYSADFHADQTWSPGALSRGHQALEHNCTACHERAFVSVRDSSCRACHTNVHDHADAARLARARPNVSGFARFRLAVAETFGQDPGRCVDCHMEHLGAQEMAPTPQQFCADCHGDLKARLPDTLLGSATDFGRQHPEFQPAVLVNWNGDQPRMRRVSLADHPREQSNLKFPHALHLLPTGGVAQMARTLRASNGYGNQLECSDCHVPTSDGVRFQPIDMQGDCAACHSLAFDRIDGTIRTLRHGDPAQVIAVIRAWYRAGGPQRPAELSAGPRGVPGDVTQIRAAIQSARAEAGLGTRAGQAIRAVFSQGGACFDCHQVVQPPAGTLDYSIRPVAFPQRYMLHGWFDHKAHQVVQRPGGPRLTGTQACLSCHQATESSDATDLMIPNAASCQACHGGEGSNSPVPSGCAMCHDYHINEGTPAMLLRRQVRGHRWETTVIRVQPQAQPAAAPAR